jgi:NurA-like 5'-3' nuclease
MEKSLTEEFLEMGEEWQGAIEALIASGTPNPKPLAALIRGSASIPSGVREMLAELLDPQEPEYLYFRLSLKSTKTPEQRRRLLETEWKVATLYRKLRSDGKSYKEAIGAVREKFLCEERMILRHVRKWDDLAERFSKEGKP